MKTSRGLQLQQSHGNGSCCSEGFPIREIQQFVRESSSLWERELLTCTAAAPRRGRLIREIHSYRLALFFPHSFTKGWDLYCYNCSPWGTAEVEYSRNLAEYSTPAVPLQSPSFRGKTICWKAKYGCTPPILTRWTRCRPKESPEKWTTCPKMIIYVHFMPKLKLWIQSRYTPTPTYFQPLNTILAMKRG